MPTQPGEGSAQLTSEPVAPPALDYATSGTARPPRTRILVRKAAWPDRVSRPTLGRQRAVETDCHPFRRRSALGRADHDGVHDRPSIADDRRLPDRHGNRRIAGLVEVAVLVADGCLRDDRRGDRGRRSPVVAGPFPGGDPEGRGGGHSGQDAAMDPVPVKPHQRVGGVGPEQGISFTAVAGLCRSPVAGIAGAVGSRPSAGAARRAINPTRIGPTGRRRWVALRHRSSLAAANCRPNPSSNAGRPPSRNDGLDEGTTTWVAGQD